MSEPSVLVVQPLFADDAAKAKLQPFECLSIGYVIAALRADGIEAEPLDAHLLGLDNEACASLAAEGGFTEVGISCPAQRTFPHAAALARCVKRRLPGAHVTIGGQFVSHMHEEAMRREPAFDAAVRGEGERTYPELVRTLARGESLAGLRGVTFRENGGLIANPAADRIEDLDTVAFPDRSYLESIVHEVRAGVRYVSVIGSRGCIYKCTFCSVDRPRTVRSPENIVAELRELGETWGVWRFMFNDDLLIGASPAMQEWAGELADLIASELPGLELWGMARADAVNPELAEKLARAGFRTIFVGLESASDDVLRRFKKGTRASMNERALRVLIASGIEPEYGFIMLEPFMSWEDLGKNLAFMRRAPYFSRHNLTNRLNVYHGAPIHTTGVERGEIDPNADLTERHHYPFQDERVRRYADITDLLKHHAFASKVDVNDIVLELRRVQGRLVEVLGPEARNLPTVVALRAAGKRLERLEADRWLSIFERLYERVADGGAPDDLARELTSYADGQLRDVADASEELRRELDRSAESLLAAA
jgi:hypothetical protein